MANRCKSSQIVSFLKQVMTALRDWERFYPDEPGLGSRWFSYNFLGPRDCPPARAGCYVIYLNGELSYVGQTKNLRARIAAHVYAYRPESDSYLTRWGEMKQVDVKAHFGLRYGDWLMREARLIRRLRPRLNIVGVGRRA